MVPMGSHHVSTVHAVTAAPRHPICHLDEVLGFLVQTGGDRLGNGGICLGRQAFEMFTGSHILGVPHLGIGNILDDWIYP